MAWKQLHDANWHIQYTGGWCLKAVQDAFGTDHPYPTAIAAWNANYGDGNHVGEPPMGITVPIYLTINGVPDAHVAIRLDDGWVASATMPGTHPQLYLHKNIQALIDTYAAVYGGMTLLGWSEYVGTEHVVEYLPNVVTATSAQVEQDYEDILKRAADPGGLLHYTTNGMTNDQVRNDLLNSAEHAKLVADEEKAAALASQPPTAVAAVKPTPITSVKQTSDEQPVPLHTPTPAPSTKGGTTMPASKPTQTPVVSKPAQKVNIAKAVNQLENTAQFASEVSNLSPVKSFLKTVLSPSTRVGRVVRTALQTISGLVLFAYLVVSLPGFDGFWASSFGSTILAPATVVVAVTAVWNGIEAIVAYTQELK